MNAPEKTNYYEQYKGPQVYRINLREGNFSYEYSPGNKIDFSLINLDGPTTQTLSIDNTSTGWLYSFLGTGYIQNNISNSQIITSEDLFLMNSGTEAQIITDPRLRALFVTMHFAEASLAKKGSGIIKLSPRSNGYVDWVGNWIEELSDNPLHIAREGEKHIQPDSPKAELPLHFHKQTLEAFFVGDGVSIMMVDLGKGIERIPMGSGDLVLVTPGVPHGLGNQRVNRSYGGTYKGIVLKIPLDPKIPVDPRDRIVQQ